MRIPTVLIATPGRLKDHLSDTDTGGGSSSRPFRRYLDELDVLVLDEVDRLLEMGFRNDIRYILSHLPDTNKRQTLLFSATVPLDLQRFLVEDQVIKTDHLFVDCVADAAAASIAADPFDSQTLNDTDDLQLSESKAPTFSHASELIEQSYVVLPHDRLVAGLAQVILSLMVPRNHKLLVFFTTTSQVKYFSNLFQRGLGRSVYSIHSKKTQNARSVTSEAFRAAREGVLFTSDVSARGLDYPNVTTVIQVGSPVDRNTYIHRLGTFASADYVRLPWPLIVERLILTLSLLGRKVARAVRAEKAKDYWCYLWKKRKPFSSKSYRISIFR
jgi:ATP-dependent RNA helicase MSS116